MVTTTSGAHELWGASTLMGLKLPRITEGGRVRVLENPHRVSGIEVGGVYQVMSVTDQMFSIKTDRFPSGAYFFLHWGEAVWD